jgi:hypothetical protein
MPRIAIISTPRSGNTWLRRQLAYVYDMHEQAAPGLDAVAWHALPERFALQLHAHPEEPLLGLLARHRFRVIVLARHPLDVLISLLNFYYHVHKPNECADRGRCRICPIVGASPLSAAFCEDYAPGPGAAEMLAWTRSWWSWPGVVQVRYEAMVADAAGELARVVEAVSQEPRRAIAAAVAANSLDQQRVKDREHYYHFWQGQPGLWKRLLPAETARAIAAAHRPVFDALGYTCDPDPDLTASEADQNWLRLQVEMRDRSIEELRRSLEAAEAKRSALERELLRVSSAHPHLDSPSPRETPPVARPRIAGPHGRLLAALGRLKAQSRRPGGE